MADSLPSTAHALREGASTAPPEPSLSKSSVATGAAAPPEWQKTKVWQRRALGAAIGVYLVAILAWSVPGNAPLVQRTRQFAEKYLLYSGLWQSWDMFSPNPLSINAYLEAELTMANGTKKTWSFPRIEKMGLWDKFRFERYRKWSVDRVRLDSYSGIWPETARYIARLHYDDPAGPPREIALVRHWRSIPSPSQEWVPIGKENEMIPEEKYTFFHYNVRPEDLVPPPAGAR